MSVGVPVKSLRLAALGAFVVALAVAGSATALPRDSMTSSGHSFPRFAYAGTDNNLWLSGARAEAPTQLTDTGGIERFTWSPTGSQIAYLVGDGLRMLDVDNPTAMVIDDAVTEYTWSPTGKWLAYLRNDPPRCELHTVSADTSQNRLLDESAVRFAWSPKGESIALFSGANCSDPNSFETATLSLIYPDGSRRRDSKQEHFPTRLLWSPNDEWIVYGMTKDPDIVDFGPRTLVAVSAESLVRSEITVDAEPPPIQDEAWQWLDYSFLPDGQSLLATAGRHCGTGGCDRQLYRIPLEDPSQRTPLLPEGFERGPAGFRFSRSGKFVAFSTGVHAGGCQDASFAGVMVPESGEMVRFSGAGVPSAPNTVPDTGGYDWSPTTDLLVKATTHEDWAGCAQPGFQPFIVDSALAVLDPEAASVSELVRTDPGEIFGPAWSPDGRSILYQVRERGASWAAADIFLVASTGSEPTRIAGGTGPTWEPLPPRAVVLVHGLGSSADVWGAEGDQGLLSYLKSIYGQENVRAFDYGDEAPGTPCRAQGDIEAYARKLEGDVKELLSTARRESGRDDLKVDFVVHSMGGLIVRRYLETKQGEDTTGRVIFLHTPHQGSYLESIQGLSDKPILDLILKGLSAAAGEALGLDFWCAAHRQMEPGSDFLARLNAVGLPEEVEYDNFFSNIRVSPYTTIWGVELPLAPFNGGDTAVTLADARLPGDCVRPDGFFSLLLADPKTVQFSCDDQSNSGAGLHVALAEARVGLPDLGLCVLAGKLCTLLAIETAPDVLAIFDLPQSHSGVMEGIVEPGHSYQVLPDGGDAQLLDAILRPRTLVRR